MRRVFYLAFAGLAACLISPLCAQSTVDAGDASRPTSKASFDLRQASIFRLDFDERTPDQQSSQQNPSYPAPTPSQGQVPAYPPPSPAQTPSGSVPPPGQPAGPFPSIAAYDPDMEKGLPDRMGSVYIPLDHSRTAALDPAQRPART